MESLYLTQAVFTTNRRNPVNPTTRRRRRIHLRTEQYRFGSNSIHCKQYDFQDFQDYAKPSRLLPATEVKLCTETSLKRIFSSFNTGESRYRSLYKVTLQTSNLYGSSLSDLNSGILLCLIDENGDSILQRIPANSIPDDPDGMILFQRGSSNEFVYEGPRLGKITAIWISLESGQWRSAGISLTAINVFEPSSEEDTEETTQYIGFQYDFKVDDILLGEKSDISMVELRPSSITKISGVNPSALFTKTLSPSTSQSSLNLSNEESMKEYANLKFSLLIYDAILILVGTSVASFSIGENSAIAFFIGGVSGFLYLLFLQRSVDGLPTESLASDRNFRGIKGPILSIALAIGFSVLAAKYSFGGDNEVAFMLTPKEILVGMMGFLACKVAVVLAAFKTVPVNLKDSEW